MTLQRAFLYGVAIVVSLSGVGTAAAQSDAFMCIDGVPGSSVDDRYPGCSEIFGVSYTVGIEGGVPPSVLGSGAAGFKTTCGLYSVTKALDASSVPLMIQSLLGRFTPEIRFVVRKPGEVPYEYFALTLRNVLIVQVQQNVVANQGAPGPDPLAPSPPGYGYPVEHIVLQPEVVSWQFTPQDPTGMPGAPVQGSYDCAANRSL